MAKRPRASVIHGKEEVARKAVLPSKVSADVPAPSVEHKQKALAAAGLGGLEDPLLGALRQRVITLACGPVPAHLLLQAHVPQLLHQNLLRRGSHQRSISLAGMRMLHMHPWLTCSTFYTRICLGPLSDQACH